MKLFFSLFCPPSPSQDIGHQEKVCRAITALTSEIERCTDQKQKATKYLKLWALRIHQDEPHHTIDNIISSIAEQLIPTMDPSNENVLIHLQMRNPHRSDDKMINLIITSPWFSTQQRHFLETISPQEKPRESVLLSSAQQQNRMLNNGYNISEAISHFTKTVEQAISGGVLSNRTKQLLTMAHDHSYSDINSRSNNGIHA